MKKLIMTTALLTSFLSAPAYSAADKYAGEYAGDCGNKVQCSLKITKKKGKNYQVDFVVANQLDARKILCKVSGKFERGPIRYSPRETYNDGLSGRLNNSYFYIVVREIDGNIDMLGGLTAGFACDNPDWMMQQMYYEIGD